MKYTILLVLSFLLSNTTCNQSQQSASKTSNSPVQKTKVSQKLPFEKITKSDEEWKAELTPEEFKILRQAGTERAFTGDLWDHKGKGSYVCRGCQLPLFDSDTKFKSGTGWPSYWKPIKEGHVAEKVDTKYGWNRVEVLCGRCDGHLGHVFDDGPKPTGLRYCINSVSLQFEKN